MDIRERLLRHLIRWYVFRYRQSLIIKHLWEASKAVFYEDNVHTRYRDLDEDLQHFYYQERKLIRERFEEHL